MNEQELFRTLEETNRVNPYTIYELHNLLDSSAPDLSETERLCFSIVTDLFGNKPLAELQNNDDYILWYDYVQLHIYAFLKGKGDYRKDEILLTAGSAILTENFINELFIRFGIKSELIPLSCIITPNIPETEVLVNHTIQSKEDMIQAAKEIQQWYQGAILIKGGHFEKRADDLLVINNEVYWLECEHIDNPNTHGTGCTLSSAIASNLALGYDLKTSVEKAKDYITGALKANLNLGHGSGPLNHCWNL